MTRPSPREQSDASVHDREGGLERLVEIMRRLRDPNEGCPWDLEQSFASIASYTIEEAYEVADAIERGNLDELKGELGDLLLQVVYHAQIAEEEAAFGLADVISTVSDKMVRRHPHVFGDANREKTAAQQTRDWEAIKAAERGSASVLDGVATGLPALTRAVKLQNRAARVGFDWPNADQVLDKITEEAAELVAVKDDRARAFEEFGDLLFVVANLARHLDLDPEAALRAANAKFIRRFHGVEAALRAEGRSPAGSDLAEMNALWDAVKRAERTAE